MHLAVVSWRDLTHPQGGGSELYVDAICRTAHTRGHRVTLVCGGPIGDHPYVAIDAGGRFGQYLRAGRLVRRHCPDADLVVDTSNGIPFFSPLWWRGPIVTIVHHLHTNQWPQHFPAPVAWAGSFVERHLVPRLYRRAQFVAASPSTATDLAALGVRGDITIVTPPAEVGMVGPDPALTSPTPQFLLLGRLVPHKRAALAVAMWPQVHAAVGGELLIAGDGPEREHVESLARDMAGVRVLGRVTDAERARLLQSSWLLVHPAEHEGWGIVIDEAAAAGVPSLGFDVPGVRDAIHDGVTGVVARSEAEFLDRWIALARDDAARRELADQALSASHQRVNHDTATQFVELCEKVVASATPRVRLHSSSTISPSKEAPTMTAVTEPSVSPAPTDAPSFAARAVALPRPGLARTVAHLRAFRKEGTEPERLYRLMAEDAMATVAAQRPVDGALMIDVGGGPGYVAEAAERRGATCITIDLNAPELWLHGRRPGIAAIGDVSVLPFRRDCAQIVHCSNVLEHAPRPRQLIDELIDVTAPGGVLYLSFTNWLSPWGGHETSPWHYLGGDYAARRYERRTGESPKNLYGESLHRLGVGTVLGWLRSRNDIEILNTSPRYYPPVFRHLMAVPLVREVASWNMRAVCRKRTEAAT
jgi:glycosyltransferase involved in cell wall biosynthesis/SAM-dependent methyltransferase